MELYEKIVQRLLNQKLCTQQTSNKYIGIVCSKHIEEL